MIIIDKNAKSQMLYFIVKTKLDMASFVPYHFVKFLRTCTYHALHYNFCWEGKLFKTDYFSRLCNRCLFKLLYKTFWKEKLGRIVARPRGNFIHCNLRMFLLFSMFFLSFYGRTRPFIFELRVYEVLYMSCFYDILHKNKCLYNKPLLIAILHMHI